MFAVDEAQFVAEIEIAWVEAALRGAVRIHAGIPFAALNQHRRVRDQRVAADMVEMEMRVDDQVDFFGVAVERRQSRADLLAGVIVELEQAGQARPEPRRRIVVCISNSASTNVSGSHSLRGVAKKSPP